MRASLTLGLCIFLSMSCSHISTPSVTGPEVPDFKKLQRGEACGYTVIIFGPFGNGSVMKAIWDGQISSVYAIEKRSTNYLLFGTDCTVVYGEAKSSSKDNKKSEQL